METIVRPAWVRELPIVAGDLALDFANTVDDPLGPQRYDHIAGYPELLVWSMRTGVLPEPGADALRQAAADDPDRAARVVKRAAAMREALNETFGAVVDGVPAGASWTRLRPYVRDAIGHADVPAPGAVSWSFGELEAPLWPVAEAAYRLLTGPGLHRLKRCVGCPWLFLDRSKNGSRRWCSMEMCGTDEKVRRYVRKRAARRR
jgi:predicted RNA-binding Zn ribbon-like protein